MSKTDRSKFHGAWLDRRSAAEMAKVSHAQLIKVSAFRWESMTPLGWPVDPEVKRMYAKSWSITLTTGGTAGWLGSESAKINAGAGTDLSGDLSMKNMAAIGHSS